VGLSPWPEDFVVTGQDWKTRGKRTDEMIEIVRGLTKGDYFSYDGKYYQIPSIKLCPTPAEPIPILFGGHSEGALRRAVSLCDGWMYAGGPEPLDDLLKRLKELRREHGRDREPFEIYASSPDALTLDGVRRLEEKGVTDIVMGFRDAYGKDTMTLQQKIDALRHYAENVIVRV
jgi:alkanesulfonate monooxygenase SsuD/methylene tetrahydromethanopterin reductase-like flavin-dependent oxidoreductase (luciferase family)